MSQRLSEFELSKKSDERRLRVAAWVLLARGAAAVFILLYFVIPMLCREWSNFTYSAGGVEALDEIGLYTACGLLCIALAWPVRQGKAGAWTLACLLAARTVIVQPILIAWNALSLPDFFKFFHFDVRDQWPLLLEIAVLAALWWAKPAVDRQPDIAAANRARVRSRQWLLVWAIWLGFLTIVAFIMRYVIRIDTYDFAMFPRTSDAIAAAVVGAAAVMTGLFIRFAYVARSRLPVRGAMIMAIAAWVLSMDGPFERPIRALALESTTWIMLFQIVPSILLLGAMTDLLHARRAPAAPARGFEPILAQPVVPIGHPPVATSIAISDTSVDNSSSPTA